MVMKAFIDDSLEDGKVLVLAGYIASGDDWDQFSEKWRERLEQARWPSFKMSEIGMSGEGARWETAGWFYRAIEDHAQAFVAVAVDIEALKKVIAELGFRPADQPFYFENPYILAFRVIIDFIAQYQHELGITEPIDLIFDERGEKRSVRDGFEVFKEHCREDVRDRLGSEPRFEDDEKFLPLQAADLLAWHVRRHWLRHGSIITEPLTVSWKPLRDIPGHRLDVNEEEIRRFLTDLKDRITASQAPRVTLTVTFSPYRSSALDDESTS